MIKNGDKFTRNLKELDSLNFFLRAEKKLKPLRRGQSFWASFQRDSSGKFANGEGTVLKNGTFDGLVIVDYAGSDEDCMVVSYDAAMDKLVSRAESCSYSGVSTLCLSEPEVANDCNETDSGDTSKDPINYVDKMLKPSERAEAEKLLRKMKVDYRRMFTALNMTAAYGNLFEVSTKKIDQVQ